MEAGAGSDGPSRPNGEDSDNNSSTSGFSMSPSSPSQSPHALKRSVGAAMHPGTTDLSTSPTSPLQSILKPTINTASSPPSEPSSGSLDSQSPLKSALRKPNSPQKPKISRRVSIEQNVQIDIGSGRSRDRLSSSQQSAASNDSARSGLGDSGVSLRFRRTPTNSKTSNRSSFALRDTVLSRMSSNVGGLRESFFGAIGRTTTVHDPLELSPNQEFDLDVIDESGGMDENIGQILKPQVDFTNWSREGYIVLGFGVALLILMIVLAETVNSLNGYSIDPGLVFGSLLTLILCVCVFVTFHGVQSYQRHPNPLIYYKCVVDIFLALRFLLDPLLLDMGVYKAHDEDSCAYLSGITQFLFLSSDSWYFAQIVDLYWSLTNPFMSVKANRRRYKMMVYSAGVFTGILAAFVPGIHGFADGNYCWTQRKTTDDTVERDLFRLNPNNWLLFYMWMILFYLSGIAVLIFGVKRLRSGLRDTLNSRREMLRNGALSITSYTIYWTIVFFCLVRPNWLKFSSDSADKQYSAQLNTALQEELIYFTIEGMTRAIQIAEQDLIRIRDRSPTQELSMAEEEARFLCEIAEKYAEYLTLNPSSLITKFYGCFKITMYDKRFYFIVMENLFDVMEEGVQIHHRFDIKGSWVNRSYKRPRRGAKVKCRHCSMMFKYGAKKSLIQCPNVVGLHEPNVVLKDNDLRTRMRIGTEEGVELYEQLRDDSLFLCDLGIMDYSLLLGVMDIEFAVDQPSRPADNSILSERTAANTATNTGTGTGTNSATTNSLTNDSFISASSSGWSSSTGSSSSESMPKKLGMNVAPSVHSLFNQPEDPLNQSRYPSCGGEPRPKRSMRKSKRVFGPGYYYVGIIDILQTWTLQKKLERFFKVDIQQKDGEGLSAIDPVRYQRRFEAKLREIIAIPKEYYHRQRRNQPKNAMFQSVQRLSPVLQAAAAFENAAAAKEARRSLPRERGDSTDTDTSGTSSSTAEDGDLEQAGRNPTPILLPFNQRLITTNSMRSQLSMTDLAV
eukprot:jgi/Phyca11/536734/estExt2_fgenesh1_pg.C_PHYCAscaffold_610038